MAKKKFARECSECGKGMNEGYIIGDGIEHYCSDACLYLNMTPAEYLELHADGEGDSYYTDWSEDPDNFEDEDEPSEQERLNLIAVALREAYKLVEEGSEAHGYIAEALAYADGDTASFDEEV
jgi:hypothetical protein